MRAARLIHIAVFAFILTGAQVAMGQITGQTTLNQLRDVARPLLIFAPKPDDARLEIQIRTLTQHAAEVHDRDLVPVALPFRNPSPSAAQFSADDAEAARRRFHIAPDDFVVILLGKDGGEKLRASKPLSMQQLNGTIDAMPMRQNEMRSRSNHQPPA